MKCLIKDCEIEREDLTQHILFQHKMSIEEYKILFNVDHIVDDDMKLKRQEGRKLKRLIECVLCHEMFSREDLLKRHQLKSLDPEHSKKLFNESNLNEWIECKICGLRRSRIDFHLVKNHGYSIVQYKNEFSSEVLSKSFIEKTSTKGHIRHKDLHGSNNPFFGHTHSEESKKKISKALFERKPSKKIEKILSEQTEKLNNQKDNVEDILEGT